MNNLSKGISYLIAAQFQAIGLLLISWWAGEWLNEKYPKDFSWYVVTIPIGVVGMLHSFYVVIRYTMMMDKKNSKKSEEEGEKK